MRRLLTGVLLLVFGCFMAYSHAEDLPGAKLSGIVDAARHVERRMRGDRTVSGVGVAGEKCGLWLSLAVRDNWDKFTASQKEQLRSFVDRPAMQKVRTMGHFAVHYDTAGSNAAAMLDRNGFLVPNSSEEYVDSVGYFFNDVFSREVGELGYDSPLQPGETTYDVYVSYTGYYGLTQPVNLIGGFSPPRSTSYIVVDNSYRGFPSDGMNGLKVTAAHEFHHAIQLASYGEWFGERYFMEITSTWMEDVMYDAVNDYYFYLKDVRTNAPRGQFATPELSFTLSNQSIEYSRAVWGKYLEERFDASVMRRTWEEIRQVPTLTALDRALSERQSSFREAFLEWSRWNLRTGANADTINGYREGAFYPLIRMRPSYQYLPPAGFISDSVQAFGSVYRPVIVNERQMLVIISNVNRAIPGGFLKFTYEMQANEAQGFKRLSNGISVRINVPDPSNWTSQEDVPTVVTEVIVSPNPFVRGTSSHVTFRLPITALGDHVRLFVMSAGLDEVFTGDLPVLQPRLLEQVIEWNCKDDSGTELPSGVYVFVLTVDGKDFTGKCALIGG